MSLRGFLLFFCVFGFLHSCKNDTVVPADAGYNYFPVNVGHYCVYDVDSVVYDDFEHDTDYYHYQIKEVLESVYSDNEGREAIRVERYKRSNDTLPWVISRVWTFCRTQTTAEKIEENERFIRLTFPVRKDKQWNGNAFNTIGEWKYKYTSVDDPFMLNNLSFDSTLLVVQKNESNLLNHRYYEERYAKKVGMIEKNVIDVYDDTLIIGVPVINRIYGGVQYSIKLTEWGQQ